jgi:hypothetical protein
MTPEEREMLLETPAACELLAEERGECAALFADMLELHLLIMAGKGDDAGADAVRDRLDRHHPTRAGLLREISIGLYKASDAAIRARDCR